MKKVTILIDGEEIQVSMTKKEIENLIKKTWPLEGNKYWFVDLNGKESYTYFYKDDGKNPLPMGNIYYTKQDARNAIRAQKLVTAIARRRKELNGDWVIDWDGNQTQWYIDRYNMTIEPEIATSDMPSPFGLYQLKTSVDIIIDEFEEELEWYFSEYIKEIN